MANGLMQWAQEWETTESLHLDSPYSLKGQRSPSTSECTQPIGCLVSNFDADALGSEDPFGILTADADIDALHKSKRRIETASTYRVVVDTFSPFKIREACGGWLSLFQFKQSDVGRSLRMCQGPKTDAKKLIGLIKGEEDQPLMETVLYLRDGDELSITVHAKSVDHAGSQCCELTMALSGQSADGVDAEREKAMPSAVEEIVDFVLSTEGKQLLNVQRVSAAFLVLTGYPETHFLEEGIAGMIGPGADGIKWKNLLSHGMEGMERETQLTLISVDGGEIPVRMRVMPQKQEASHGEKKKKITELAFVCVFSAKNPQDTSSNRTRSSPASSCSSFDSGHGGQSESGSALFDDVSSASSFASTSSSGGKQNSNLDRSVLLHLQGMKQLAKARAQKNRGGAD